MSDKLFGGVWLLLCLGGLVIGWGITTEYSYEPVGPRPFPLVILALMALCAVGLLLRKPDSVRWPDRRVLRRLLAMMVMLMAYGWVFESLGFPLATALLTCGIAMLFGASWWAGALSGIISGLLLFYSFDRLLDVTLPIGSWLS
ncbi:tripartite tricarboxylate transporter TctB family protein [Pantoea sp. 1.19]|uniref:tripartite tricarboxylate transporter TctB family protein n=1 Tax=Pantoea sp. 1.19 TaxID=1925589 RepID=UPI000948E979|nr:tripartite tricarboxylate transporter TctB family protein [Pantoea sp. 1.19]